MFDIHCHILPGVDDGARSLEVAIEMCRMATADGITHIVATPHANYEYEYDREKHLDLLRDLQEKCGGSPQLSLGCDFHFSYDNVQELLEDRGKFTIGETSYLLVELNDYSVPPRLKENLEQLISQGIQPVLTHPERNPILQRQPEMVLDWVDAGVIVQVTANSLTGFWGKIAQRTARWLLDRDAVHVVATDAHDTRHRPPLLSSARHLLADWKGEELATALFEGNPGAIVRGEPLVYFPEPAR